ncbi:MAG: hypothetical protein OYL97_02605 [Candidatus Poribacteria bacterium]|nr:hypothetical protein [Candidatus Poribacteria bacterium]
MNPVISKILDILVGGIITLAFLGLLAAGIVGSFLLFFSLLKRRPNLREFRATVDSAVHEKQGLTKHEKYIWMQKIQKFGKTNLKKILVSKVTSKSMILPTIILIALTVLFWLLAAMMGFRAR